MLNRHISVTENISDNIAVMHLSSVGLLFYAIELCYSLESPVWSAAVRAGVLHRSTEPRPDVQ